MLSKLLNMDKKSGKKTKCVLWHIAAILAVIVAAIIVISLVAVAIPVGDGTAGDGAGNNDNWIDPPTGTGNPNTNPGNTFEPTSKQWVEPPTSSWGGVTSPNAIRV